MFRINLHSDNPERFKFLGLINNDKHVDCLFAYQYKGDIRLTIRQAPNGFYFFRAKPDLNQINADRAKHEGYLQAAVSEHQIAVAKEDLLAFSVLRHAAQGMICKRVDFDLDKKNGVITFQGKTIVARKDLSQGETAPYLVTDEVLGRKVPPKEEPTATVTNAEEKAAPAVSETVAPVAAAPAPPMIYHSEPVRLRRAPETTKDDGGPPIGSALGIEVRKVRGRHVVMRGRPPRAPGR